MTKLAFRLLMIDIMTFVVNALGAVLAAIEVGGVGLTEWISLTVATVAVLTGIVEFTQLRNQVVSCNLALKDLQRMELWWNSLSLVRRRTPTVKAVIVATAERAYLDVVDAHTTAAKNTQRAVEKSLDGDEGDAENADES